MPADGAPTTAARPGLFIALALLAVVAALCGGSAAREAPLRLMAVELSALPPLVLAALAIQRERLALPFGLLIFPLAAVAVIGWQLVPLPPAVWTALPGRDVEAAILRQAGLTPGWRPASLAPADTLRGLLALLPPVAAAWAASVIDAHRRRLASVLWLAIAAVSLGLGMLQRQGLAPQLYEVINPASPVGLFANRNHNAALMVAALPLAGALVADAVRRRAWSVGAVLALTVGLVALAGLAAIRSRAGVLLGLPALLGAGAVVWFVRPASRRATAAAALGGLALVAAAGGALFAGPLAARFAETHVEPRSQIWPVVARAAAAHAPVGAGAGAYETVYRAVEPLVLLTPYTPPHADNDYLEVWLECGVPGATLVLAFLTWLAPNLLRAWRASAADDLARAGTVAIALLLVHSAVDEPLRTTALSTLFGFLVGVAAAPRVRRPTASRGPTG